MDHNIQNNIESGWQSFVCSVILKCPTRKVKEEINDDN